MANHIPVPPDMKPESIVHELFKARGDAEKHRSQGQFALSGLYYARAERLRKELVRRENLPK